jgi:hypothetical protein
MAHGTFDANYGRQVTIDLCHSCRAFWFDSHESLQLTPGSVLEIFKRIHDHTDEPRAPLAEGIDCPRCRVRLTRVIDRRGSTRFTYAECPKRHGRFITFYHFLREKHFVRALEPGELAELKAIVRSVNCSNCGGPIDLASNDACPFCRSPLAILDSEQVTKMLEGLQAAERDRREIDPSLPMDVIVARLKAEHAFARMSPKGRTSSFGAQWIEEPGLLESGIGSLLDAIKNGLRSA